MDWKNLKKRSNVFGTVLKTCQKNICGRAEFLEML